MHRSRSLHAKNRRLQQKRQPSRPSPAALLQHSCNFSQLRVLPCQACVTVTRKKHGERRLSVAMFVLGGSTVNQFFDEVRTALTHYRKGRRCIAGDIGLVVYSCPSLALASEDPTIQSHTECLRPTHLVGD
jgi:hypothetical protein